MSPVSGFISNITERLFWNKDLNLSSLWVIISSAFTRSVISTAMTRHFPPFSIAIPVRCTYIGKLSFVDNLISHVSLALILNTLSRNRLKVCLVSFETKNPNLLFFSRERSLPSMSEPLMLISIISPSGERVK